LPAWSRPPLVITGLTLALADVVPVGYQIGIAVLVLAGVFALQGRRDALKDRLVAREAE
jgi:hypothetical protein